MTDVPLAQRNIVALGGGGFLEEGSHLLNDYLLGLTGKSRPRICMIPTASADSEKEDRERRDWRHLVQPRTNDRAARVIAMCCSSKARTPGL